MDDGPMDLSGSRFGMSSFPSNGYPMKMIAGTEGVSVSTVQRLKKEFGL